MSRKIIEVFCDGGARGNPGPAASAFVVFDGQRVLAKGGKFLGVATNNFAEYKSLNLALNWLIKNKEKIQFDGVKIYMDSQLVVRQMRGEYKTKSTNILGLAQSAKEKQKNLGVEVLVCEISREKNSLADKLVNKILDEKVARP